MVINIIGQKKMDYEMKEATVVCSEKAHREASENHCLHVLPEDEYDNQIKN